MNRRLAQINIDINS